MTVSSDIQGDVGFVYLDFANLAIGDTQNIVIGLQDPATQVVSAELEIVDEANENSISIPVEKTVEGALLFSFQLPAVNGASVYVMTKLRYTSVDYSGSKINHDVELNGVDNNYTFTVVAEKKDNYSTNSTDPQLQMSTYTISDHGTLTEKSSLGEALAAANSENNSIAQSRAFSNKHEIVVAIDPGHGGSDSGATGYGLMEKDLTLKIARYCRAELESYSGVRVVMTRDSDEYVGLSERVDRAVASKADVFVSIHINAGGGTGSEVWIPNPSSYNYYAHVSGSELADRIISKLSALGLTNRGVKFRNSEYYNGSGPFYNPDGSISDYYTVIADSRNYGIPGIIVEHAFIDDPQDANFMSSDANLKLLGEADAKAIAEQYDLHQVNEDAYKGIYDYNYYIANNPDILQAWGGDKAKTLEHFLNHGIQEGRQGCEVFNLSYYRSHYSDLQRAFGDDNSAYYYHFLNHGMSEGRQASASFSLASYYNENADLRRCCGRDWRSYFIHYLDHGIAEGRAGTGCDELEDPAVSLDGRDYSAVYDMWYYRGANADLAALSNVGTEFLSVVDDGYLLWHFANHGMSEGRQASASFSLASYYNEYPDLRRCFGEDWRSYFIHYLDHGIAEGRHPVGCDDLIEDDSLIMGEPRTTVSQMVAYYNSTNHPYPAYVYGGKGASSIEDFCVLVYEEATAEGVRPEVLFTQAMKETGWLQFGGLVKNDYCNFGGLGATGSGVAGAVFPDVRTGLRAQVQHLKCYASTDSLCNPLVDPRWNNVVNQHGRGSAPLLEDLNGKWAVPGDSYGQDILKMITKLMSF